MSNHSYILALYRQLIAQQLGAQQPTALVRRLKIFAEVYQLKPEDHAQVVKELRDDPEQFYDEHNQSFAEWLQLRRTKLRNRHVASLSTPPYDKSLWKRRLPSSPTQWENLIAVVAGLLLVGILVATVISSMGWPG